MPKSTGLSQFSCGAPCRQQGVALVVALIFLLMMTLIGVTAMQTTGQQERMAGNARQRNLAFQGAEACLRWGETGWGSGKGLEAATLPSFDNSTPGLRQPVPASDIGTLEIGAFWMDTYNWASASQQCPTRAELSEQARYVIEELPRASSHGSSVKFGPLPDAGFYRVTARSLGGTTDAVVILQSIFRR